MSGFEEKPILANMTSVLWGGKAYWVGNHRSLGLVLCDSVFQPGSYDGHIKLFIVSEQRTGFFAKEVLCMIDPPAMPIEDLVQAIDTATKAAKEIAKIPHPSVADDMVMIKMDDKTYWVGQHQYMGLVLYDPESQLYVDRFHVRLFVPAERRMDYRSLRSVTKYMPSEPLKGEEESVAQFYHHLRTRARVTHCRNCKKNLNSVNFTICSECGWIRCSCGACQRAEHKEKVGVPETTISSAPATGQIDGGKPSLARARVAGYGLECLYHITHTSNLYSICKHGILSNHEAHQRGFIQKDISDPSVQIRRDREDPRYHRALHAYAPLYLNPRNPMLRVLGHLQESLCIIEIDVKILDDKEFLLTDGNAAADKTNFFASLDDFHRLPWDALKAERWNDKDDGKRKMCSEVLIHPSVPVSYITGLHFYKELPPSSMLPAIELPKHVTPSLFFEVAT